MRGLALLVLLALALSLLPGAGPPAAVPPEIKKLIKQLDDDDVVVRRAAMKKLEERGEDVLSVLRAAATDEKDADTRLRLLVVIRAIREKDWGLIKAMGAGAAIKVFPLGGGYWLNRIRFSRDGKYAVAAGGGLILYDLATGKETKRVLEVGGARPGLDVSRDGKYAVTAHAAELAFHLVELPSLKTVQTFKGHLRNVHAVAISPDNSRVVSIGTDITIRLWDAKTGKELGRFVDFIGSPGDAVFSPDGKQLLTGQAAPKGNRLVRLWDVETRKLIRSFEGHGGAVTGVAFLPDGKTGVSGGSDGTVRVWDLESGKEVRKMDHKVQLNDLAVSPDGRRALTAGFGDKLVKLWDIKTGKLIYTFDGHVGDVLSVAFSPDGRQALSCDTICCVRQWKLGK